MIVFLRWITFIYLLTFTSFAQNKLTNWSLVYEDSFPSLNTEFWKKASHTFENNLAQFTPANIVVNNGLLELHLNKKLIKEKRFAGAELRSKHSFKYGKFTARVKPAKGAGVVSGFFLYDPRGHNHEEIDLEFTGKDTSGVHFNHWTDKKEHHQSIPLHFNATDSFHEYSILWTPDYICWEIDGSEVYRTITDIPQRKMKLMLNVWASKSNSWAGKLDPADLPAKFEIDYIKIYSLE